jgi:hypothetical protein
MVGYESTLDTLQEKFKSFIVEATAGQKNQAAALRSRKLSMELRNDMKDFRTVSVQNDDEIRKNRKESK